MQMRASDERQIELQENLVIVPMQARDAADAIGQLGARLQAGGYVRDSWIEAVIEREQAFATGLPTPGIGVAIPHADVEHVLKQAIAVGVLERPVEFGEMGGSPDSKVAVRIVCALAVAHAEAVITVLQHLVSVFQQPDILTQIAAAQTSAEVVTTFNHYLRIE
jgi:PTS system galactitol-specific IIA component